MLHKGNYGSKFLWRTHRHPQNSQLFSEYFFGIRLHVFPGRSAKEHDSASRCGQINQFGKGLAGSTVYNYTKPFGFGKQCRCLWFRSIIGAGGGSKSDGFFNFYVRT